MSGSRFRPDLRPSAPHPRLEFASAAARVLGSVVVSAGHAALLTAVLGLDRPGPVAPSFDLGSWPRGRSWKPSPGESFSACGPSRSSAVGSETALLGQAAPASYPGSLRTMCAAVCVGLHGQASTPMRSPFTRPASAMPGPQSNIVDFWGRRARVRDSQEWSGSRTTGNPSSVWRLRVEPSKKAHQVHTLDRRRPHPGRDRAGRPPSGEAVEAALDQYQLQAVVKYMTWRARHLQPAHHQVPLTILLLSHRHQRTPLQARTPENQTMPTS